jgi:hypothetical protein
MEPIQNKITRHNKCVDTVTSKCVTWDGPTITCLDGTELCKGDSIEQSLFLMATKYCEILDAVNLSNLDVCVNNIPGGGTVAEGSTIRDVFNVLINKLCIVNTKADEISANANIEETIVIPGCIISYLTTNNQPVPVNTTVTIKEFAELLATIICGMLINITTLQSDAAYLLNQIDELWFALQACATATNPNVQLTCSNNGQLNPDNAPVPVQTGLSYLEAAFCALQAAVGRPDDIINGIAKQCPDLGNQERLSSGGTMSGTSGWIDSPINLAQSISNMWLTVCDMRASVANILSSCCFTPCSYFELGYDLVFDPNGTYVDIVFNNPAVSPVVYTDPNSMSAHPTYDGGSAATLPSWVTTGFPTAGQTDVSVILNDGGTSNYILSNTPNQPINYYTTSTGTQIRITFDGIYDTTSLNQTITIQFDYTVFDAATGVTTNCTINQVDGFIYECDAPPIYPYDINVVYPPSQLGTQLTFTIKALMIIDDAPQDLDGAGTTSSSPTTVTSNTLADTSVGPWTLNQWMVAPPGSGASYLVHIVSGPGAGQIRYITGNTATTNIITVFPAWDASNLPNNTSVYEIKDRRYPYPLNTVGYPAAINTWATGTGVNAPKYNIWVTETSQYDPNDPSTWGTVVQYNANVNSLTGLTVTTASGVLSPNTDYTILVSVPYLCGNSEVQVLGNTSPVLVSVQPSQGQIGAGGVPYSSINTYVSNIYSNSSTPSTGGVGTLITAYQFPVALPIGTNLSQFDIQMIPPNWFTGGGAVLGALCKCGLSLTNPGQLDPATTLPLRNSYLGQYRGAAVSIMYFDPTISTYQPLLDRVGNAFVTNTLDDAGLTFPANLPILPLPATSVNPLAIPLPANYADSDYKVEVLYNQNAYPTNFTPGFHTITIKQLSITVNNPTGVTRTINQSLGLPAPNTWPAPSDYVTIYTEARQWDDSSKTYSTLYVPPPTPFAAVNTDPSNPMPGSYAPGASYSNIYTPVSGNTMSVTAGDALRVIVYLPTFGFGNNYTMTATLNITPITGSNFYCATNNITISNSTIVDFPGGIIVSSYIPQSALITEDYDITVVLNIILTP